MWVFLGLTIMGLVIALWAWTPGTWPFDGEKFRKAGESKDDWHRRVEESTR